MGSLILYSAARPLTKEHQPIRLPDGRVLWIRVEPAFHLDLENALDNCHPVEGETVLNTIEEPNDTEEEVQP